MPDSIQPKKTQLVIIIIIILLLTAAVVVYLLIGNKEEATNSSSTVNKTNTNLANTVANSNTVDTDVDLASYDGKVLNIGSTDGKVTGQVAMAYQPAEQMPLKVVYFLKVTDDLPKTQMATNGAGYFYIASHTTSSAIREGDGTGTLDEILCNHDQVPDVLALARAGSISVDTYGGCADQYSFSATTDTFYQVYSTSYNQYDFNYDRITSNDVLAVFDSGPYWKADPTTGGSSVDDDEVVANAPIARQYTLQYSG